MSRLGYTLFVASLLGSSAAAQKVDSLLAQMTLEEKLGQLHLPTVNNRMSAQQLALLRRGLVGGFLNLIGTAQAREAQRDRATQVAAGARRPAESWPRAERAQCERAITREHGGPRWGLQSHRTWPSLADAQGRNCGPGA